MAKKKSRSGKDAQWAKAKRLCRLSAEDVRMAREMGMNPRKLVKNIPSKSQPWKAPVREWIRQLYRKRHHKAVRELPRPAKQQPEPLRPQRSDAPQERNAAPDDDVPF